MKEYKELLYQVLNLMPKVFGKGAPPEFYGPLLKEIQRLEKNA